MMKTTALFFSMLTILVCCTAPSKEDLIQGKWEISTWIDSRNNSDLLKTQDAPNYSVRFEKDTVYVLEAEKEKTHSYKFKWNIENDSLKVGNLGTFKIVMINKEKCILKIKIRSIFTDEIELYTETIILVKK